MSSLGLRRWIDVRMGAALLLLLVPLATGIFFLDTIRQGLLDGPELVLLTSDTHGLSRGALVWVAGVPAGRVLDIGFVGGHGEDRRSDIAVRMVLLRRVAPFLRSDAVGQIGRAALLAPPVVKLTPGSPERQPYDFRQPLRESPAVDLDTFRSLADSGRVGLRNLSAAADSLRRLRTTGRGSLQLLRKNPGVLASLARSRTDAGTVLEAWASATELRSFRNDTLVRRSLALTSERLGRFQGRADSLADSSAEVVEALGKLGSRLDRLARRIDTADGTLGRLGRDAELAVQIDRTRSSLDSLLLDARARPLRYLRLRLF